MAILDWDNYFLEIAQLVSKRSTCIQRHVGALIVKNKQILATGYNGPPSGVNPCDVVGCLREKMNVPSGERHELCRGLHGEQNAIIQASFHGVSTNGASLYCMHQPCVVCAKMIIKAGIKVVVFTEGSPDELSQSFFNEVNILVRKLDPVNVLEAAAC